MLGRLICFTTLVLLCLTFSLWTPQADFPRVPFLEFLKNIPGWLEWLALGVSMVSLAASAMITRSKASPFQWVAIFGLTLLILADQHRFQPWAFQMLLLLLVFSLAQQVRYRSPVNELIAVQEPELDKAKISSDSTSPRLLRMQLAGWLTISIYIYSGISKLDYSFATTHGQQLISGLLMNSSNVAEWPKSVSVPLTLLMPIGEISVAVLLLVPRTQRVGYLISLGMHAALIWAVGPWGLGHQPAVLAWNLYFIAQNGLLFASSRELTFEAIEVDHAQKRRRDVVAQAIIAIAILFPILSPFGFYDVWPAWGLYASRPARVRCYLNEAAREKLPPRLQKYVGQPQEIFSPWNRFHLDQWSLHAHDAPIYPEDRFHVAAALAVARRYNLSGDLKVVHQSAAGWLSLERVSQEFVGVDEIQEFAADFLLNCNGRLR
ncbi:MAG: hypothetical protein CMJ78_16525 [Planctomycetaceae bacterium]|nr:hypothetical protein [Planctomycetaceae bacterium]